MAVRRRRRLLGGGALFRYSAGDPLPSGSTFTRSTTATYVDQNGVVQTAPINTLRNGHYVGMAPRTNYALNSRGVGGTNWSNNGSAIGVALNASVSPDGSMTASHLTQTAVNGSSRFLNSATVPLAAGSPVVVSFWIRLVSGTPINNIVLATLETGGTQGTGTNIAPSITASWQRFSFVRTLSAGTTSFTGAISFVGWATTGTASDAVYAVSECQIESGTAATADIPTTTAAVTVVDGGVPTILLEGSRTNSVLWSRDLTNAAWSKTVGFAVAQNAVGLDGTANSATTITDPDGANFILWQQNITVPNDSNTHTVSAWIAKDTVTTRFPIVKIALTGGTTTVTGQRSLNTQTGASSPNGSTAGPTSRVVDAGLWWVVEVVVPNNSTGNVTMQVIIFAAGQKTLGTDDPTATGSCVVGHVQVELNSAFYSSPIFTTTAAVTRGADSPPYWLYSFTGDQTIYFKGIDLGSAQVSGGAYYVAVGNGTTNPRIALYTPGPSAVNLFENNGSVGAGPLGAAVTIANGSTVEGRGVVSAATFVVGASINAAAEVTNSTAGIAAPAAWSANHLSLNGTDLGSNTGFIAVQSVKIAAGIRSLTEMRGF